MKYRLEVATLALTLAIVAGVSPWAYPRSTSVATTAAPVDAATGVGIAVGTSGIAAADPLPPASITEFEALARRT